MTDNSGDTRDYIEHARWLLEWHNKRSEGLTTRAVALLGFDGVILSLVLRGVPDEINPTGWTWLWFALTVAALLGSAFFALWCISTAKVEMPSVTDLRQQWADHMAAPKSGAGVPQIAEDLVHGGNLSEPSPLTDSKDEADKRVKRFKCATHALFAALLLLSALTYNIIQNLPGR